uniref:Methyltransferase domain-containing protein n=1 Tax=Pyramimonas obovata TaxID=1411642 RepID=A0A7S0QV71_9CHLO|eukprot:CAMPEP_0118934748 /NCGR_PEP_ID=MMETSP1169-20130426/14059_1 /TAXON_ID=36882 /ORGANISM="Pyramimonas obovata, Strain CCMP722" /LENGTH=427 /DNA_ID=CAMNT_0006877683 /DNA_START=40 /DNA_END=1323 /DNA_ORIENTATION=+
MTSHACMNVHRQSLSSNRALSSRGRHTSLASNVACKRMAPPSKHASFAPVAASSRENAGRTQSGEVNPLYDIASIRAENQQKQAELKTTTQVAGTCPPQTPKSMLTNPAAIAVGLTLAAAGTKYILDKPSRTYQPGENTVGKEYNDWTDEGVLEYYWGEHIHLGYYTDEELAAGYKKKDFIDAKKDFVFEMLKWADVQNSPKTILDCGCGIGGTSRLLAKQFPDAKVIGITLSDSQVRRGTELAKEQGITNIEFRVMNALEMEFEDNSIDFVWACESGEHMPDKSAYVNEMVRVLKPGGNLAIATWCQREETPETPLTEEDNENLQFLYDEWAHPYFISFEEYARIMEATGTMEKVSGEDWVKNTLASWRHSIWVGVYDPWPVVFKGPWVWYKTVREIVTLERMHRAFDRGLMTYGMIKGTKKAAEL